MTDADSEFPVTSAQSGNPPKCAIEEYQNQPGFGLLGHFRVDDEIIRYTTTQTGPEKFTGCTRGQEGTTAAAHNQGAIVWWFAFPGALIPRVLAHEVGHLVNLQHRTDFWEENGWHNVMNGRIPAGATAGNGYWNVFRDAGRNEDALDGQFRLKP